MIEAFPLSWPHGWPRAKRRASSQFNTALGAARGHLMNEIRLLGGRNIVLSSNLELRRDGLPYANQRQPSDPGIAVYFEYQGKSMAFACDKYLRVEDNVRAVGKTIEAIRGIERWGASDMMERAFTGFEALPHLAEEPWHVVLMVPEDAPAELVEKQYRKLRSAYHPDRPDGSPEMFDRIIRAHQSWRESKGAKEQR